jgi:hypothetical protein
VLAEVQKTDQQRIQLAGFAVEIRSGPDMHLEGEQKIGRGNCYFSR